jgi:ribosomal protein L22
MTPADEKPQDEELEPTAGATEDAQPEEPAADTESAPVEQADLEEVAADTPTPVAEVTTEAGEPEAAGAAGGDEHDADEDEDEDEDQADADADDADDAERVDDDDEVDEDEVDEDEVDEDEVDEDEGEEAPAAEVAPSRRLRRRRGASKDRAAAETPEKSAPARRKPRRDPNLPAPVVRAQAKYVRSSARKARLVCDHIRGKTVDEARAILAHTPRAIARDWSKLLESAVANAEHNHELVGEDLYVKAVHADEGPTIKRFQPRAMGRATKIRKRTSHLTILLTPKE